MNVKEIKEKLKTMEESPSKEVFSYIKPILNTAVWRELMLSYFGSKKYSNSKFLAQILVEDNYKNIEEAIKLKRAFTNNLHWKSFELLKNSRIIKYKQFYRELQFVKENQKYWNDKAKFYRDEIGKYTYEEIIIHFTSYFQKFKNYSKETPNNRILITSYEAILIQLLNDFLTQRKKQEFIKDMVPKKYILEEFTNLLEEELPPIKPEMYVFPKEKISKQKENFRKIIEFFFAKFDNEYQLNKYFSGFASFEIIDNKEAELVTNAMYLKYRQTLEKGTCEESYITNTSYNVIKKELQNKSDLWDKEFALKRIASLGYFKFYNIPLLISYKNKTIAIEKILTVLQTFSVTLFPQGRLFSKIGKENFTGKRKLKEDFLKLFIPNYICGFKKEKLIKKIATYFGYSIEESTLIVDFLTTDINNKEQYLDTSLNPFLQIGENIYWLSSFLKERKWENLLHRKIWREQVINQEEVASKTEKSVSNQFVSAGFNAISSYEYHWNTNKKGEIDVLAYKDKTLFVIELKNTILFEDMLHHKNYEVRTFQTKAANQLERAVDYIKENFENVQDKLSIDCTLKELEIVTMIVSNSFQGDNIYFNQSHLKISLFELVVILKNDLYNVLINKMGSLLFDNEEWELPMQFNTNIINRNNPDIKGEIDTITKESVNLWEDKNYCNSKDITNAIKKNLVFKHLGENRNYNKEHIVLRKSDINHKYLE